MANITTRTRADGTSAHQVRIRLKSGGVIVHQETRSFDARVHKRKDVERWALVREAELSAPGARLATQSSRVTLGEAVARYQREYGARDAWGRSKTAAIEALRKTRLAAMPLVGVTARHLIDHVRARRDGGAGPATAQNDLIWVRVLFKVARPAWGLPVDIRVVDDAIAHCRAQRLTARALQRTRRPTRAELDRLLDWFARCDGRQKIPMCELILFAVFSARREAEICQMRRADYDAGSAVHLLRDVKDPRERGRVARVSVPEEAVLILLRQQDGGPLWFPYNPRSVQAAFARACKVLGIEGLRFHDLRHECASWLFERGWTVPQVAAVTGHRTWANLQRYTHMQGPEAFDKYQDWSWRPRAGVAQHVK